ncbi:MAG: hypothetical protein ACP5N3_02095 [Candidatus Nanoarchaeia archaeon]
MKKSEVNKFLRKEVAVVLVDDCTIEGRLKKIDDKTAYIFDNESEQVVPCQIKNIKELKELN